MYIGVYQEAHHKIFDSHFELFEVFYGEFYTFFSIEVLTGNIQTKGV